MKKKMQFKKGQVGIWAYALMLSIVVVILALALVPAGNEFISSAMNVSTADAIGLDCNNASISNFVKGTCVITDFSQVYFFGGLILIGVGIITSKVILG